MAEPGATDPQESRQLAQGFSAGVNAEFRQEEKNMKLKKQHTQDHCYYQYPAQSRPQPAYLLLDLEDGELTADYSGDIGNGVSMRVWHGVDVQVDFDPRLTADAINRLMDQVADDLQTVLDGASVEWDGNNWVGILTDDAREALESARQTAERFDDFDEMLVIIDDDWWDSPCDLARQCLRRKCGPAELIDDLLNDACYDYCYTDTDRLAEVLQESIDDIVEHAIDCLAVDLDGDTASMTCANDLVIPARQLWYDLASGDDIRAAADAAWAQIKGNPWPDDRDFGARGYWSVGEWLAVYMAAMLWPLEAEFPPDVTD